MIIIMFFRQMSVGSCFFGGIIENCEAKVSDDLRACESERVESGRWHAITLTLMATTQLCLTCSVLRLCHLSSVVPLHIFLPHSVFASVSFLLFHDLHVFPYLSGSFPASLLPSVESLPPLLFQVFLSRIDINEINIAQWIISWGSGISNRCFVRYRFL